MLVVSGWGHKMVDTFEKMDAINPTSDVSVVGQAKQVVGGVSV